VAGAVGDGFWLTLRGGRDDDFAGAEQVREDSPALEGASLRGFIVVPRDAAALLQPVGEGGADLSRMLETLLRQRVP